MAFVQLFVAERFYAGNHSRNFFVRVLSEGFMNALFKRFGAKFIRGVENEKYYAFAAVFYMRRVALIANRSVRLNK